MFLFFLTRVLFLVRKARPPAEIGWVALEQFIIHHFNEFPDSLSYALWCVGRHCHAPAAEPDPGRRFRVIQTRWRHRFRPFRSLGSARPAGADLSLIILIISQYRSLVLPGHLPVSEQKSAPGPRTQFIINHFPGLF